MSIPRFLKQTVLLMSAIAISLSAQAATQCAKSLQELSPFERDYLTLDKVEIQQVRPLTHEPVAPATTYTLRNNGFRLNDNPPANPSDPFDPGAALDEANIILDQIINLGKKIWTIIEKGKPVVNVKTDNASALPKGLDSWMSLEGWKVPASAAYRVQYSNVYGVNVVDFTYRIVYTYGGNARGKGQYLANASIVPEDLDVSWGYTFNADVSVPTVVNAGTRESPIGQAEMLLNWQVSTIVKESRSSRDYAIRGDGALVDLQTHDVYRP